MTFRFEATQMIHHANRIIKIYHDEDPPNPRKDYDNASIIYYWHYRKIVGDTELNNHTSKEEMIERRK